MSMSREPLYDLDPASGVFFRRGFDENDFIYSDTSESKLQELFRKSMDLSVGSPELSAGISDWPTEYHISFQRSNLLRGIDLSGFESVLEIGCGCGAITRQLGELGLSVTAMDGSLQRAVATRLRCADLDNVEVVCDSFESLSIAKRYDLVTLIGVLEYAPMFIKGDTPFEAMLSLARNFLNPNGVLVIAIENKLGLKYFAGHEEDHLGKPYWGIQGLYHSTGPRTLGKVEMESLLHKVGFSSQFFCYPFPDYKVPEVIVSEKALGHPTFKIADIIAGKSSRSYNNVVNLAFDESLIWNSLADNSLISHLSNSFLIFCSCIKNDSRLPVAWLAKQFSFHPYQRRLVSTTFTENGGQLFVCKDTIYLNNGSTQEDIHVEPYVIGDNLIFKLRRVFASGGSLQDAANVLVPWINCLMKLRSVSEGKWTEWKLSREAIDCVPHNIIVHNEEATFIDREVFEELPQNIDFSWVVIRGLLLSLALTADYGCFEGHGVKDILVRLASLYGLDLTNELIKKAISNERLVALGASAPPKERIFVEAFLDSFLESRVRHTPTLVREEALQFKKIVTQRDYFERILEVRIAELTSCKAELGRALNALGAANARYSALEVALNNLTREFAIFKTTTGLQVSKLIPLYSKVRRHISKGSGRFLRKIFNYNPLGQA